MAQDRITGRTQKEVEELRLEYQDSKMHKRYDVPFERAYCLSEVRHQPDDYEGPTRYCPNRTSNLTDEEWDERYDDEYDNMDVRSNCHNCRYHGRNVPGEATVENLEPYTAAITHGLTAKDEHLHMDFDENEQALYDGIVEQWPDVYDWPAEDEDPARYLILRKVATNVVRSVRVEDYLDDEGEVHMASIYEEGVEIGQEPEENPLSSEYRLLVGEIVSMLKELGVTPKERASQNAQKKSAGGLEAIGEAVNEAVVGSDNEYDPDQFEDDENTT